jgi:hypothetical protein
MPFSVIVDNEAQASGLTEPSARKALAERVEVLHTVFEEAGKELDPSKVKFQEFKDGPALVSFIRGLNDEIDWVGKRCANFSVSSDTKWAARPKGDTCRSQ